jgi:SAM-dependent methyltransferase
MSLDYFIGVNAAEIDRLRTQHEAWKPETSLLWTDGGLASCESIVDLGCGPGFSSVDLARLVGPTREVHAVDKAAAYLSYLNERARRLGISNITTHAADVIRPGALSATHDGAFCRWFLAFLRNDLDVALDNIRQSLRPGGVFAAMEYLTLRSTTCAPPSASFDAHTRAWIEFYAQHGGDSSIGRSLPQRLTAAGFRIRSIRCVGGVAHPQHRWWTWWDRLIRDFGPRFVELGLLRSAEWDELQRDWNMFSQDPNSFIHTPLLLQVVAERA